MAGWIIQGVRGEGKSLCAVGKAKEYLLQGRPVATNLDLYLENLLPADNQTVAYRLPDQPRPEDFAMLPPAYDPKYKGEDKNGLLILDELALWMNCRAWNSKGRDQIISWLLLSRKRHWDLILLCQDHEMIDAQVKTTCCDYLVQASRTDRRKIPYLAPILEFFFISAYMPKIHLYDVYYGLNYQDARVEQWRFSGKDLYSGYDTNQVFSDGLDVVGNDRLGYRSHDMRAVYTYLPAAYLTRRKFIDKLQAQIDDLIDIKPKTEEGAIMAKARTNKSDGIKMKALLLTVALVIFIGWRVATSDFKLPGASSTASAPVTQTPAVPSLPSVSDVLKTTENKQDGKQLFLDRLMASYRPRLAAFLSAPSKVKGSPDRITGLVEFYDGDTLVEQFTIQQLKAFGCAFVVQPYGADIVTSTGVYPVTAWPRNSVVSSPTSVVDRGKKENGA